MEPSTTEEKQEKQKSVIDKNDRTYSRILDMQARIKEGKEGLKELVGKKVVLLMGPTGAGKSTLANAIIQPDKIKFDDDTGNFNAPPLNHKNRQMFEIGHGALSCTSLPGYFPLGFDIYLVDCPGLGDSDKYAEYPNQTLVREIIKNAAEVIVAVVIKGASLEAARSEGLLRLMTSVLRMLTPEKGVRSSRAFIVPLINKAENYKTGK